MSEAHPSTKERVAFLCLTGWAGCIEQPIIVVGETPKRYRIRAAERVRLSGRNRYLLPGQKTLVPRHAVRFP